MDQPDLKTLYQQQILSHAKKPHNQGPLADATHDATCTNPLCGDKVTVHAILEGGRVRVLHFESRGCAIAKGSASLMTTLAEGKTPSEVADLSQTLTGLVEGREDIEDEHPLAPYRGVAAFPARTRCATLAWETLLKALDAPAD